MAGIAESRLPYLLTFLVYQFLNVHLKYQITSLLVLGGKTSVSFDGTIVYVYILYLAAGTMTNV